MIRTGLPTTGAFPSSGIVDQNSQSRTAAYPPPRAEAPLPPPAVAVVHHASTTNNDGWDQPPPAANNHAIAHAQNGANGWDASASHVRIEGIAVLKPEEVVLDGDFGTTTAFVQQKWNMLDEDKCELMFPGSHVVQMLTNAFVLSMENLRSPMG